MPSHWQQWFHCTTTTFGVWLPGDPRGWRTIKHRQHIEGDYHNPPPENRDRALHQHASAQRNRPAIIVPAEMRPLICDTFRDALHHHDVLVQAICASATHVHVLARFPATGVAGLSPEHHRADHLNPVPRYTLGKAMSWTTHVFKKHLKSQSPGSPDPGNNVVIYPSGLEGLSAGGLWAKHPSIKPIADESHFHNARRYIRAHDQQAAAVWIRE